MTPLKPRTLHVAWVDAGERRLVARALHEAGFTQSRIARLLDVSQAQVSRDVAPPKGYLVRFFE